ncbi:MULTISPECIES: HAD-IA family hydrolase [unclassified Pseudoalteromonas]|uniref:HAD-IA family hydrolase n=1 Tax=unclassified Pseudoalteromonas TaxID=194690 RepID=UPI00110A006C|nr:MULTISPECIES: HAD-IA family hydrolase [unclassified Pseudoalteromonas]MBW4966800.1 HAD-IA family hydrolase [Pseudoalteromonas sp. CR1]TMN81335.1 HAD family hydrolase [Pseudoalteromonas sp. S410]TMN89316.1 HAD family hydrolase [Pseudoalteromonas sp. S408]TMN95094.1 HAD family hydrolase [Pseudoalteromonas sp. S407]TMN96561.1 HAD family hydrolase [Pseudoalteromonas sp. S409]
MSSKQYKLIIFDWDGTIMDSIGKIVNCIKYSAESLSIAPPSDIAIKNIIGLSLEKAMAVLFPNHPTKQTALINAYKAHYKVDSTATPVFDDVANVLNALKQNGAVLAIATGKGRDGLERLLDQSQLRHFFSATRTSDDAQSKPSPDMLYQLLAELGVSGNEALMIGDTQIDLKMAQAANIDSIGVTMGVHNAQQLSEFNPIATVDSYQQLQQVLMG